MTRYLVLTIIIIAWALLVLTCSKPDSDGTVKTASRGEELFGKQRCANCHGIAGEGTGNGPSLTGSKEHFAKDQLITYLKDPSAYITKDERLLRQQSEYRSLMPSFKHLDSLDLNELSEYVRSL